MPEFAVGGLIERGPGDRPDALPLGLTGCTFSAAMRKLSPNAQAFTLATLNAGTIPEPSEETL